MRLFGQKYYSGFTLLEVLVAISIFTMSILAIMSILTSGIASTNNIKQKIVASYLAREGVEYVKNLRDTMVISGVSSPAGWTSFITNLSSACGTDCYINDVGSLSICPDGVCPSLLYDSATSKYGYASGIDSGFIRKITVGPITNNNERKISSTVFWIQGSGQQSVTFSDNLFNWIE